MKRRLVAFATVTTLTIGFLAFGFLRTATSVASSGLARSFGASLELVTATGSSALVAPLPEISADKENPKAEQALVRIADQPAGPASLIDEIAALYVTGSVDVAAETATATADTARVALLETPTAASVASLLGSIDLTDLVGSIGRLNLPAAAATEPAILADALHGVVNLSCRQLDEQLRGMPSLERLQAITQGSIAQQVKIKPLGIDTLSTELPVVGNINKLNDNDFDRYDATTRKERAAAYHLRVDLPVIDALGIKAGTRLLEIAIYEVNAENLTAPNLAEATVRASVDMLHVTILDKITGLAELDLKIGHAETSLTNCAQGTDDVLVTKLVDSIGGVTTVGQTGLTAKPGDVVAYKLGLTNRSSRICSVTNIVDQIPTGFTFVSTAGDFGNGVFDARTNRLTWSGVSFGPGPLKTQTVTLRISPTIPSGIYVNRATATGTCTPATAEAPGIQVLGPITVNVLKTVESIAGKLVTTTTGLSAKRGNEVLYKVVVTNSSDESCTISQVVDTLPQGFAMKSTAGQLGAGAYDAGGGTITWDGLEIAPGESAEQAVLTTISPTIAAGTYRNRVTATGSCGTFNGESPAITVAGVLPNRITRPGPLPKTGINDTLMWFGPLLLVGAAAGVTVMRRGR